jgi:tetratricopeptide (TPR) repeat protein
MKSDHRHELKTNELADWIAHFPEWVKENRTTLIATGAVVVVALGVYFLKFRREDTVLARRQVRLTNLVTQLPARQEEIAANLAQGVDQSIVLQPLANDLLDFADTAGKKEMAATALLARAEALRAELHYRLADPASGDIAGQITKAQDSYRKALDLAASAPALAAAAQFGLGLCEEELGNFDKAREIYKQMVDDETYNGTTAQAAAAQRLRTMDDYKTAVVFKPTPVPSAAATQPTVQIEPAAANSPALTLPGPNETTEVTPTTPAQGQDTTGETAGTEVSEANAPAGN